MKIQLAESDPGWATVFLNEKKLLERILPPDSRVEHIGSTSVKGLCARPTIDILCGLKEFLVTAELLDKIGSLDYEYVEAYNAIIPERRYFRKTGEHNFHLHLVQSGGRFWERHILFRDFLRKNGSARDQYASLKRQLAEKDWIDGNAYTGAKSEFIRSIEKLAESEGSKPSARY